MWLNMLFLDSQEVFASKELLTSKAKPQKAHKGVWSKEAGDESGFVLNFSFRKIFPIAIKKCGTFITAFKSYDDLWDS